MRNSRKVDVEDIMRAHIAHFCPVARANQPELFWTEVYPAYSSEGLGY